MDKDPCVFMFIIQVLTLKLTYEKGAKINDVITIHVNHVNFVPQCQNLLHKYEFVNFESIIR